MRDGIVDQGAGAFGLAQRPAGQQAQRRMAAGRAARRLLGVQADGLLAAAGTASMQGCRSGDQYSCTRLARRSAAGAPAGRSWRRPGPADPAHRRGPVRGRVRRPWRFVPARRHRRGWRWRCPRYQPACTTPTRCARQTARPAAPGWPGSVAAPAPAAVRRARPVRAVPAGSPPRRRHTGARLPGHWRRRRRPRRRRPARASCGWRCAGSRPVQDRRLPVCTPAAADSTDRYRGPAARRWLASAAPPRSGTSWTAWRAACRRGRPAVAREVGAAGDDHTGADEAGKQERLCEFLRVGHGDWSVRVHSVSSRCCVERRRAAGLPARDAGRCLVRRVPACSR